MRLIGPDNSSKFMEWHNSDITTFKYAICAQMFFKNFRKTK